MIVANLNSVEEWRDHERKCYDGEAVLQEEKEQKENVTGSKKLCHSQQNSCHQRSHYHHASVEYCPRQPETKAPISIDHFAFLGKSWELTEKYPALSLGKGQSKRDHIGGLGC